MVNVNTQVSSSMELPFGEYTLFCFIINPVVSVEKRLSVAAVCFFLLFRLFVRQPFGSRAPLDHNRFRVEMSSPFVSAFFTRL